MGRPLPTAFAALVAITLAGGDSAVAEKRRAFVTSIAGQGDLSAWPGTSGSDPLVWGDQICQNRANVGGRPNPSSYRAWLSSSTTDAYCHVRGQTGKRASGCVGTAGVAGPWFLANGITPWTGNLDQLTDVTNPRIFRGVLQNEYGNTITTLDYRHWTGTNPDGTYDPNSTCGDWTSDLASSSGEAGIALGSTTYWTSGWSRKCDTHQALLCLSVGASEEPGLPNSPGSLVFVTSTKGKGELGLWPEADGEIGFAAGDRICRNLAADAHLPAPESFVAWISGSSRDAADAVTSNGPFRRIDGLVLAANKAELLDGTLDTSIHQNELGKYVPGDLRVWTGTDPDGTYDEVHLDDCFQWENKAYLGDHGYASFQRVREWTDFDWVQDAYVPCTVEFALYCFSNVVTLFWDGFESTGDTSRWSFAAP